MTGQNRKILLLCLVVVCATTVATILYYNQATQTYKPGVSAQYDKAVSMALSLYKQKKDLGLDFTNGPCLTNNLFPGWVVDTVHDPRQPVDDLDENQCESFVKGAARHFVELDIDGNVVRVQ